MNFKDRRRAAGNKMIEQSLDKLFGKRPFKMTFTQENWKLA